MVYVSGVSTTAQARVHLYSEMEKLGTQCVYADTDSIIYSHKEGQYNIKSSNYLGCFSNELSEDDHIELFCAAGVKNYSYITHKGIKEVKVRGFTLGVDACKVINMDVMKGKVVDHNTDKVYTVEKNAIARDKYNYLVFTRSRQKLYSVVNDKRIFKEDHTSLPYGSWHDPSAKTLIVNELGVEQFREVETFNYYDLCNQRNDL